jgi:hypothetical protein
LFFPRNFPKMQQPQSPSASSTSWAEFARRHGLDIEIQGLDDVSKKATSIHEPPLIVSCEGCSKPILASAFARHWGIAFGTLK